MFCLRTTLPRPRASSARTRARRRAARNAAIRRARTASHAADEPKRAVEVTAAAIGGPVSVLGASPPGCHISASGIVATVVATLGVRRFVPHGNQAAQAFLSLLESQLTAVECPSLVRYFRLV